MASPLPSPEVLPLLGPAALSPTRLFASFLVLLGFLLVARFSPRRSPVALKAKRQGARTVLLVGPLASGKTALFSKLVYGHAPQTHTSMKENEAVIKAKWTAGPEEAAGEKGEKEALLDGDEPPALPLATPLHLVDLPGHARLRTRALAQYLPAADGIIFAVDGQNGLTGKNVRDAGEHFHILLSLLALLSNTRSTLPPVLILLTKSDLLPSTTTSSAQLTIDRAKQLLLRELERRRLAGSGAGSASALLKGSARGGAPLSAGARLEGLEAIPTSSSGSSSSRGALGSLLALFGLGSTSSHSSSSSGSTSAAHLPSDESEALATAAEDVFAFEGAATWERLERAVRCEFEWAVASVRGSQSAGAGAGAARGVERVWDWVERL